MSSDQGYLRKSPEEVVRREPSEPPRESFIRAKGSDDGVESALDVFLQTQEPMALAAFPEPVISEALLHRLRIVEAKTLVGFGAWMTAPVLTALDSDVIGLQRAGIEFAGLMPQPAFVRPLLVMALDSPAPLRSLARDTLCGFDGLHNACVWLRNLLAGPKTSQQRRRRSMELLALFGDPRALTPLIDMLGDFDRSVARAAHEALRMLTCHDLGTMRSAWQRWAEKSQTRSRVDWLIEALADRRPELREGALTALTRITGHSFGVNLGDPRSNFLVAQEQFAALRLHSPEELRGLSIMPPSASDTDAKVG